MKDNKNIIAIDCTFLIDSVSTYQHLYQFESALMDFFKERGMNFESIKSAKGNNIRDFYLITKKDEVRPPALPQPKKAPQPLTNQQKVLQKRK